MRKRGIREGKQRGNEEKGMGKNLTSTFISRQKKNGV